LAVLGEAGTQIEGSQGGIGTHEEAARGDDGIGLDTIERVPDSAYLQRTAGVERNGKGRRGTIQPIHVDQLTKGDVLPGNVSQLIPRKIEETAQ
jgi:hypothetical protein